ncbi:hypothetical protein P8452_13330 [Trifolium repens]|nr:hypothetical protein P8452_13330 [Trifolium repens]
MNRKKMPMEDHPQILMTSDLLLCCLMVEGSYPLHFKKSTMDATQTFVYLDVNDILCAARHVTDASIAPDQTDSQSPYTDED